MMVTIVKILLFFALLGRSSAGNTTSYAANFIFGDSLLEVGNNNYIFTLSKANYYPFGIDYEHGNPTGRFTNGRTIMDIIGQELSKTYFTPPPAYLAPTTVGRVILKGVNYASAAGGILNETGLLFGGRINMRAQVDNFANTRQEIIKMIGQVEAEELLKDSLFLVGIGSNDFLNNYLIPGRILKPTPDVFFDSLISSLRQDFARIYNMGARKIVVTNIGPIGCIPYMRDVNLPTPNDTCVDFPNQLVQTFNSQLKSLVEKLEANLTGSKFLYADVYHILSEVMENHTSYGFENVKSACCNAGGIHGGLIPCLPPSNICSNRSKFLFWDPYHPTDAANVIIANKLLHGVITDISPISIIQLLQS